MKRLGDDRLAALFRLLVGLVFVYAALPKLFEPVRFAEDVANYQLLPDWLVHPTAVMLPGVELALGIALVLGVAPRGAALAVSALMLLFLGAEGQALARSIDIDCGCFGGGGDSISVWTLLRNFGLLAASAHVLVFDRGRLSFATLYRANGRS